MILEEIQCFLLGARVVLAQQERFAQERCQRVRLALIGTEMRCVRRCNHQFVRGDRQKFAVGLRGLCADQTDIAGAVCDLVYHIQTVRTAGAEPNFRGLLVVRCQQLGQQIQRWHGRYADMQHGFLLVGQFQNGFVPQIEDFCGIIIQRLAGRCHRECFCCALEQLRVQLLFQIADVCADGRLRQVQLLCSK